jgi:hypothetical protein
VALAAAVLPCVAYVVTLHPGLPAGDSGELIAVAATGGVAHPPGYPLYTLLAGAFGRLVPLGSFAWRLNLLSAVCAAAAAGVLAAAAFRATRSVPGALVAAWAFAFAGPVVSMALVAEVFALNALLAACVMLALASAPGRSLAPLAGLGALALSHHHTLLLLALPALVVTAVRALRAAGPGAGRRALAARATGFALAGLAPLLWLPLASLRGDGVVWGEPQTPRGFLAHLLRAEYGTFRLDPAGAGLAAHGGHLADFLAAIPRGLGWPGAALLLAGGWAVVRSRPLRPLGLALLAWLALQLAFFTRIGFPAEVPLYRGVVERFHVMPFAVLALVAGLGAAGLAGAVRAAPLRRALAAVLVAVPLVAALPALRERSERGNHFAESLGRGILASLPPRTVLFVEGDLLHNSLLHLTRVERLRTDVAVLDQQLMTYPWYVRRARRAHPGVLPHLAAAGRITLSDGRELEGVAIDRADGTTDVLWEGGHSTVPSARVKHRVPADPAGLYGRSRARFRRGPLLEQGEDRYSGLPGSRNLLWLDHLAGRRPVAFLGTREDSYALRYALTPFGAVALAHPKQTGLSPAGRLSAALDAAGAWEPSTTSRRYLPTSLETSERWRWDELRARTLRLLALPGMDSVVRSLSPERGRALEALRHAAPVAGPAPQP